MFTLKYCFTNRNGIEFPIPAKGFRAFRSFVFARTDGIGKPEVSREDYSEKGIKKVLGIPFVSKAEAWEDIFEHLEADDVNEAVLINFGYKDVAKDRVRKAIDLLYWEKERSYPVLVSRMTATDDHFSTGLYVFLPEFDEMLYTVSSEKIAFYDEVVTGSSHRYLNEVVILVNEADFDEMVRLTLLKQRLRRLRRSR